MTELLRAAAEAARNLLWQLLVEEGRGTIQLNEEIHSQVDFAERLLTKYLEEDDNGEV